ncbi:MinD/ParA family protein [Azotosporobacter soli]|uniref:MinD/ParA family protein n=1 Tax=Azotosporobacter soli TaxID=3055040 RepID=UPI0031FEA38D
MNDQAEKLRKMVEDNSFKNKSSVIKAQASEAKVITVTSGKGGVGKTNFTVNLALALAQLGKRVLILDADLGMANVDVVLGCSAPYNILHLLEEGFGIQDIVVDAPGGIKFISGGSGIYQLANLNEQQLQNIIHQVVVCDDWADIILVDTGAGLNKGVMKFVIAADEVIIVTTPEPTAITDAYAMMKAYASYQGVAPLRLIVNRVVEKEEGDLVVGKLMNVAMRFLGVSVTELGLVYEDRNMVKAVKSQKPLLTTYPGTISAKCIMEIAERMVTGDEVKTTSGLRGFFDKFLTMIR